MPFSIIRNDITRLDVDAIVNAANSELAGGGGVDGAIHAAAGPELDEACRKLHGCRTGQAKITPGFNLPAKYIIHTVGPIWHGGKYREKELLESCYWNSLKLARENGCKSVAFPLISSGIYGYPRKEALDVAVNTITHFLDQDDSDMMVSLVVYDKESFRISKQLYKDIQNFLDDNYLPEPEFSRQTEEAPLLLTSPRSERGGFLSRVKEFPSPIEEELSDEDEYKELHEELNSLDETFSEMVLRKIDEKGMTDPQCYKKANIDRRLFSKIRSNPHYKPSKETALALAIALELSLDETRDLLEKAGYALSKADKADVIIEYFIRKGIYNIFKINEALFAFDQCPLGA